MAKKRSSRARTRAANTNFHPSEDQIIAALRGETSLVSELQLQQLLGDELREYRKLATGSRSATRTRGTKPKVYLLHGIMGSELGRERRLPGNDVIWLGLADIILGTIRQLRIGDGDDRGVKALDFLPGVYLKMRLHLEREGFEVVKHYYDWRQNVATLGAELKSRIERDSAAAVHVVAHSMGGLVTRAAIKQGLRKISSFIMLATPNHGSLAPVEALRGQYSIARWIAGATPMTDAEEMAQEIFATFPGLYQMILGRDQHPDLDLFSLANWPQQGPRPLSPLLKLGAGAQSLLAAPEDTPDIPWYLIAGYGQETKVEAALDGAEFRYRVTRDGDGTVPVDSALLPGVRKTWFANAGHGFFANNASVREATVEILRTGDTAVLPDKRPATTRAAQWVTERELKQVALVRTRTRGGDESLLQKYRSLFNEAEPLALAEVVSAAPVARADSTGFTHKLNRVTVGRQRQRRLEVVLYRGSITDVEARAYVLGTFAGVSPSGAALAVDDLMGGAITEIIGHNMFASRTGEVFILPLARHRVRAETAVFVGLGPYDQFKKADVPPPSPNETGPVFDYHVHVPTLEIAAENAARTLARTRVDSFATVLLGGTVIDDLRASTESLLRGFLHGLEAMDQDESVRRIFICEMNDDRYDSVKANLFRLASTNLCEGVELVFNEREPSPEALKLRALGISTRTITPGNEPVYLTVRTGPGGNGPGGNGNNGVNQAIWRFIPLGPSSRAAVREFPMTVDWQATQDLIRTVPVGEGRNAGHLKALGPALAKALLPDELITELREHGDRPLVLLHDAGPAARVPWETIPVMDKTTPVSRSSGMSRRFISTQSECLRWAGIAAADGKLRVLIIANPTGDLPGAAQEAREVARLLKDNRLFTVDDSLTGARATKDAILNKLRTGGYDIVHYSGHAGFDPLEPGRLGLKAAGGAIISGPDIAGIPRLPFLMVLNACQSARTRGTKPAPVHSVAETLLCSGIANFIGTYWEVFDDSARDFAVRLYSALLEGKTLGDAVRLGRETIKASADWANYQLFGNPDAKVRTE